MSSREENRKRRQSSGRLRRADQASQIRCKAMGHLWYPITPQRVPTFGVAVDHRCESCGSERHDNISRLTGELLQRWYVLSDEYQGLEKHDKMYWRAEYIETLGDQAVASEMPNGPK